MEEMYSEWVGLMSPNNEAEEGAMGLTSKPITHLAGDQLKLIENSISKVESQNDQWVGTSDIANSSKSVTDHLPADLANNSKSITGPLANNSAGFL